MALRVNPVDFYWFNLRLGLGTDYTRYFEYPRALELLQLPDGPCSLLDVGSGRRGQFPLFLAHRFHELTVYSTDPRDDFFTQRTYIKRLHLASDLQKGRLQLKQMNILKPDLPESSLDRISCISTIEHIPGTQDTEAIVQMAKLLKPGGLLVLSIPYNRFRNGEIYRPKAAYTMAGAAPRMADRSFFERVYDEDWLQARLIGPSRLREMKRFYFGEPHGSLGRILHRGAQRKGFLATVFFKSYLPHILMPLLSPIFLRTITSGQFDAEDWSGVGVLLQLRKEE